MDYTPKLVDFGLTKIINGKDENVVCAPLSFLLLCVCNYKHYKFEHCCGA
jgi:hypothetical protein